MKWFKKIWLVIKLWWRGQPSPFQTLIVEELPDCIDPKCIYLVGENGYLWFVAMSCPCKCQAILQLSLLPDGHPRWELSQHDDGAISLYPSVWRTKGCHSHFFLRHNKIEWCKPTTEIHLNKISDKNKPTDWL